MLRCWRAAVVVVVLAGCSNLPGGEPMVPCPEVGFIKDADHRKTAESEAWIAGYKYQCHYRPRDGYYIEFNLPLMAIKTTPDIKVQKIALPYFIALLAPDETVLRRESLVAELEFDDKGGAQEVEEHALHIPGMTPETAPRHKIGVGFVLTPEELAANRAKKETP